jgi:nitrous oxide reductase accessory protein NosL
MLCLTVPGSSQVPQDIQTHHACLYCGMNREMYDFSRMLIEYDDGTTTPACSLHCVAIDLANKIDKAPKAILVGDFQTKQLIDAESAKWILEGSKPGVMTKRGKWAFATQAGAEAFLATNGGKLGTFEQAIKMAYEDMYDDTMAIRARRKAKKMGMAMPAAPQSPAPTHP